MTKPLVPKVVLLLVAFGGGVRNVHADMMADSPVKFPKQGALPAKYPPDQPSKNRETPEEGYYIFGTPERSLAQIAKIRSEMPTGRFSAPPQDWTHLQRTHRILTEGGELHLLALGDSIVNDTMRSGWVAKLQEAYPKADIRATVYVRGGGGCQHYKEEERIAKHVVPRKPDLVFIGGISQRDTESRNPSGHRHFRHGRSPRSGGPGQGRPLGYGSLWQVARGAGRRRALRLPRHDHAVGRVHPLGERASASVLSRRGSRQ